MSALEKLVKLCDDMDITEQLNIFDDAFLPNNAKKELLALKRYIIELESRIAAANAGKPLEFPPLVSINGEAMDVESVILFPLEGTTRNLFYKRRDPDVTRPILVEVVDRE